MRQLILGVSIGPNSYLENETIAKYEIMDGAPVKGESIPIRVFLAGYDLTPTMRDINKKFSVRYYLNLVLMDDEDRRYFKQQVLCYLLSGMNLCRCKYILTCAYVRFLSIQEITLWRKGEKARKIGAGMAQSPTMNMPTHLVSADHHRRETNVESDADASSAPGVENMKREVDSPAEISNSETGVDRSPVIQSPLEANPPPLSD